MIESEINARSKTMVKEEDATHRDDEGEREDKEIPATAPGVFSEEPDEEYELEAGVSVDATDGHTESDHDEVSIPKTGAALDDAAEPDTSLDTDLGIEADAKDGATENNAQEVVLPETGASVSIEEDEES